MSKDIAISVKDLHKSFRLPKEHSSELKRAFINFVRGIKGYKELSVLRGISFDIEKGDFVGIVGRNGSGKSTLLKILAGVYTPDQGSVQINGSLVPFIELGVGFNPELTGRENIYMNGAMLGFSNDDVDKMYDEIVDFAELHDFMDQKLKNYSSGMQVRLAFSIAIRAKSDILLLDEVLAVGDEAFQRKCFAYFSQLKHDKQTVILVTHSMDSVEQFCNKAVLINKGKIEHAGSPSLVAQKYRELNMPVLVKSTTNDKVEIPDITGSQKDNINVAVTMRKLADEKMLLFDIEIDSRIDLINPTMTLIILRDTGEVVYWWKMDEESDEKLEVKKDKKVRLNLKVQDIFPDGVFDVRIGIHRSDQGEDYITLNTATRFRIMNQSRHVNDVFWKPNTTFSIE